MDEKQVPEGVLAKGSEVILLMAEEDMVRDFAHMILEESGYVVLDACNERECLALCAGHQGPIDLLVTDLMIAELGGPDLAERALKLRLGLKVMFMSGHVALNEDARKGGVILQKPFTPVGLVERVREALDSNAPSRLIMTAAEPGAANEVLSHVHNGIDCIRSYYPARSVLLPTAETP